MFDTSEKAIQFGSLLAEMYRLTTGGSLSVIPFPEKFNEQAEADFARASQTAQEQLRQVKRHKSGSVTTAHFPYVALCAACGVGLAARHQKRHDKEPRGEYLCPVCLAKGVERRQESLDNFLRPFMQTVIRDKQAGRLYKWPGGDQANGSEDADPTADIGRLDPRRYVAYLVADGNNMGKVFDQCSAAQMCQLSEGMTTALRESLAAVTHTLKREQSAIDVDFIPTLPLILGGDDLFALIPAPWALDFAQVFCREFEQRMTALVDSLQLTKRTALPERMTVTAVIVICKESYPFYLAHAVGMDRLKKAKQVAKRLAREAGQKMSSLVDFEVILGSQAGVKPMSGVYRPSLRPYWVTDQPVPAGWGVKLEALLKHRLTLLILPQKRLAQLRSLYKPSVLPQKEGDDTLPRWVARRDGVLKRIGRSEKALTAVQEAFQALGGDAWLESSRTADTEWYGHGLPDLLTAWDFAYQISEPRQHYEEV